VAVPLRKPSAGGRAENTNAHVAQPQVGTGGQAASGPTGGEGRT
jgi:hypothetical protein